MWVSLWERPQFTIFEKGRKSSKKNSNPKYKLTKLFKMDRGRKAMPVQNKACMERYIKRCQERHRQKASASYWSTTVVSTGIRLTFDNAFLQLHGHSFGIWNAASTIKVQGKRRTSGRKQRRTLWWKIESIRLKLKIDCCLKKCPI